MEAFSSFRICAQSFIAIDGGVLVVTTLDGETIGEPRRFSGEGGAIFELRNGLIARVREFDNRAELYAAGGISEEEARRRAVRRPRAHRARPLMAERAPAQPA